MESKRETRVLRLEYPLLAGTAAAGGELFRTPADRLRELESKLEERERRFARVLESTRSEALEKGKQAAENERTAWRQECSLQLRNAIEEFRTRSEEYFARVEQEVVRLALAVAERILHREAQADPLLLSGAVRVALGQLAQSTEVRLRIPSAHQEMWAEMVRLMPGLPLRPDVVADPELQTGEAILESTLGTVDLGLHTQLEEAERGFFDPPGVREEARSPETRGGKRD
jgi:flagellar assembly protein FliH